MALSRVTTWSSGQVLTAAAQNGEFDNILNNALSLISPLTGVLDFNGNRLDNLSKGSLSTPGLNFTGDQNTGLHSSAADTMELVVGGIRGIQITGVSTLAVNWLDLRNSMTGLPLTLAAEGTDTNIDVMILPAGTGYVQIATAGGYVGSTLRPGLALADGRAGLVQVTSGTVSIVADLREGLRVRGNPTATNYLIIGAASASATPYLGVTGGDTDIDFELRAQGAGAITTATAFVATSFRGGGAMRSNALYAQSPAKAWAVFDGSANILNSFNITSVSRTAAGRYRVTWTRAFASQHYPVLAFPHGITGGDYRVFAGIDPASMPTTTYVDVSVADAANTPSDATVYLVAFGMQ